MRPSPADRGGHAKIQNPGIIFGWATTALRVQREPSFGFPIQGQAECYELGAIHPAARHAPAGLVVDGQMERPPADARAGLHR